MASNKVTQQTGAGLYGVHRTCAEMAVVSHSTSHITKSAVSTPKMHKATVTHSQMQNWITFKGLTHKKWNLQQKQQQQQHTHTNTHTHTHFHPCNTHLHSLKPSRPQARKWLFPSWVEGIGGRWASPVQLWDHTGDLSHIWPLTLRQIALPTQTSGLNNIMCVWIHAAFLSPFLHYRVKRFSPKCIALKVDRTRKYTVCRHIPASFSPEILQAVTVKGLMEVAHLFLGWWIMHVSFQFSQLGACYIFSMVQLPLLGNISNMHTSLCMWLHICCSCCMKTGNKVHWTVSLGEKSLAALLGSRICVSNAPLPTLKWGTSLPRNMYINFIQFLVIQSVFSDRVKGGLLLYNAST